MAIRKAIRRGETTYDEVTVSIVQLISDAEIWQSLCTAMGDPSSERSNALAELQQLASSGSAQDNLASEREAKEAQDALRASLDLAESESKEKGADPSTIEANRLRMQVVKLKTQVRFVGYVPYRTGHFVLAALFCGRFVSIAR
jgi:hypothetical protein